MKKILIINGHPNKESFCYALAESYKNAAVKAGAEVKEIVIADLEFNLNLQFGYQKKVELEADLKESWSKIKWADHLVWVHPVWWGGLPAITKGFVDRLFLPKMAFQFRENSVWWDKLLKGKTAHVITTLDQPRWYYWLAFGQPSINQLKKSILEFCGIKPVRVTCIGPVAKSNLVLRKKWLAKIENFGRRQA